MCVCNLLFRSVAQSCVTLCGPMDCSPSVSSVHGISQARILEWFVISFSRGSSQPRDWTCVSCIGREILYPLGHLGSPLVCNCKANSAFCDVHVLIVKGYMNCECICVRDMTYQLPGNSKWDLKVLCLQLSKLSIDFRITLSKKTFFNLLNSWLIMAIYKHTPWKLGA